MKPRTIQLTWPGKESGADSRARGLARARPRQVPARAWAAPGGSLLVQDDNLSALSTLSGTHEGEVTLAYMDPPFFTGRVHDAKIGKKDDRVRVAAFDDRWEDQASFLETLAARLEATWRLLAPHGSLVIHVDPRTSHYIKVLADEIFGPEAFASEIVWRYRRWPSKTPNFQRVHDVLLRFRKDPKVRPRWNQPYEPLAASTLTTWGTRKQKAVFATSGRRARSSSTEEATPGAPMGDVWELGLIAPVAHERTGYPSQKPEALLERIILALSDPGDWVLDPYAGSGTTLAVAARAGRRFIGIDESLVAIDTVQKRLEKAGVKLVPVTREASSPNALPELREVSPAGGR